MEYQDFIQSKKWQSEIVGVKIEPEQLHPILFPFQRDTTLWAIRKGRAAIFGGCGTGKTFEQLEWARFSGKFVLIVCPLSVAQQTMEEGKKIDIEVKFAERPILEPGIYIANYQKLHHFAGVNYDAIVLDESSILKSFTAKTRDLLIEQFSHIPRRLCCTATPSPNDIAELGNHSEFLGQMKRQEMLSHFFVHDAQGLASEADWRLKGHAKDEFWRWVATWAVFIRSPSDLGYEDDLFILPPLIVRNEQVKTSFIPEGQLFPSMTAGIKGRSQARKFSLDDRVETSARIINENNEQWLVWCNLNDEGQKLHKLLPDSVLIEGATPDDKRVEYEMQWRSGKVKTLISKPVQYGHGMNWQFCHNVIYLGLSDSWENYYQSLRRCWRFGQKSPVNVIIVTSKAEYAVIENINRKEKQAEELANGIVQHMKEAMMDEVFGQEKKIGPYKTAEEEGQGWKVYLGDSMERIKELPDEVMGLSITSIPFSNLFTYSPSERDLGNCKDYEEFFSHFDYLIPEWSRVTMPGRRACVHVQQVAMTIVKNGVIAWYDFRADVVRNFVKHGWIYDGEIVIDKNPQVAAVRTKSKQLMFVQLKKDSSWVRPTMADYVLLFRNSGENPVPVDTDVSNDEWIKWARPIWYDIRETNTLNAAEARENDDERHICPLQLETIERCLRLWSNKGDIIFDPFSGIASTGYEALKHGRKYVGIELKESYFQTGIRNLRAAESLSREKDPLFALIENAD